MEKVTHISSAQKFLPGFIKFVDEHIGLEDHLFLIGGGDSRYIFEQGRHIRRLKHDFSSLIYVIDRLYRSEKIILHGLFSHVIIILLFFQPWLLKKCHWAVWGGDLYSFSLSKKKISWYVKEFFRRPVIKNMGHIVTYIKGDYELARQWYATKAKYHECIMYPSNLFKDHIVAPKNHDSINIQVGNSADPSNNHLEIFKRLEPFKGKNIRIYAPLSYGDEKYAKRVMQAGEDTFGSDFIALTEFLPYDEYISFMSTVDIAIFNHNRQQAMGNIITLLGMGKKVYMRPDVTQWKLLQEKTVTIFNVNEINLEKIKESEARINRTMIKAYFSEENYLQQLQALFQS